MTTFAPRFFLNQIIIMQGFFKKIIGSIFGNKTDKDIAELQPIVVQINQEYAKLSSLTNDQLRYKTTEFRNRIKQHLQKVEDEISELEKKSESNPNMEAADLEKNYKEVDRLKKSRDEQLEVVLKEILPAAFAVVKEAARRFKENPELKATALPIDRDLSVSRDHIIIDGDEVTYLNNWIAAGNRITWDMMHYDTQLIGGMTLHAGKISEMATGEGKTLVATLPAYLNGLAGFGVHIVTVNDYLARRDSEWMGTLYNFLGLTCECIDKYQPHSEDRKKAYNADITYGTNNEFGFDYLRDNMLRSKDELVQRKFHYAMVDEVDSVLIDDARTPLIISGPIAKEDTQEFHLLKPRIVNIVNAQRELINKYLVDAKRKLEANNVGYNEGEGGLDLFRAFRGLPKNKALIKFLSETGNKAILQKTENYFLAEQQKNMPLADKELYFIIDEKHNSVELTDKGVDLITGQGDDPEFFILPELSTQLAAIEKTYTDPEERIAAKDKLYQDFSIKSERIHSVKQLLKAYTLFEKDVEYIVDNGKVKIVDEQTGRVLDGRRYSDGLHQAIEAKEEVQIEAATQTFATITLQNFFRMYHKVAGMTGTAETEAQEFWSIYKLDCVIVPTNRPITRKDNEDLVFKTIREKYNAVINEIEQLRAAGRPVLVGTTSVEISEKLSRMLQMKGIPHNVLNAKQHAREAEIVAAAGQAGAVTIATNMAGRGTDIKLGPGVKEAGGLAIIGTERHDSRRVDRQLRGRAGRQGDPGSSQFYVSLEDDLMRKFGSDRIASLMDKMGYKEGEIIQHSMISKSIERAQKKVEENNFGVRKRLLEYDDVMNNQREVIYRRRRNALFGERLSLDLSNGFHDLGLDIIQNAQKMGDYEAFKMELIRNFSHESSITQQDFTTKSATQLAQILYNEVEDHYQRRCHQLMENTMNVFRNIHAERGDVIKNVIVPFTDGKKSINITVDLQKNLETEGKELVKSLEKAVSLAFIDEQWKEHLRQMSDLKQSVQSAVWEQKDPLLIYKFEAFEIFKQLLIEINFEVSSFLFKCGIPMATNNEVKTAPQQPQKTDMSKMHTGREGEEAEDVKEAKEEQNTVSKPMPRAQPVQVGPKIGRNDPCPCGSGKKYKQCHGKDME